MMEVPRDLSPDVFHRVHEDTTFTQLMRNVPVSLASLTRGLVKARSSNDVQACFKNDRAVYAFLAIVVTSLLSIVTARLTKRRTVETSFSPYFRTM